MCVGVCAGCFMKNATLRIIYKHLESTPTNILYQNIRYMVTIYSEITLFLACPMLALFKHPFFCAVPAMAFSNDYNFSCSNLQNV